MILEFSIENFYSFKDKVTFSMIGNHSETLSSNFNKINNYKVLKSAAIYGANATGKSNLFKVLEKVVMMLRNSNNMNYYDDLPIRTFAFDEKNKDKPSIFEIIFIFNKIKYVYGFSATKEKIIEEYLYYYPNGKETKIFYRHKNKYSFTARLNKDLSYIATKNAENKFFLATATNWNYDKTRPAYEFLTKHINICQDINDLEDYSLEKYLEDKSIKQFALDFLQRADINITDYTIDRREIYKSWEQTYSRNYNNYFYQVYFKHNNSKETLSLDEESLGTKIIFFLIPFLKDAINNKGILIIDELDKSLHPFLVEYIVSLFNSEDLNKNGSQLLFNTHDTNLLNLNVLRRDQIWFTEKKDDGSSDLYSLSDFSIRQNENIEKGYMLGRYGAIPFITNDINLLQKED